MSIVKDIWRPLIVDAPIESIWRRGSIDGLPHRWLPFERPLRFLADPFGSVRGHQRFVFVERYDYRTRHGVIDAMAIDAAGGVIERREVLAEPWHLSYPLVFDADGEIWMLPEAHRSGALHLYRAVSFPWVWERAARIDLDHVPVDATPLRHEGLWWLFYSSSDAPMDSLLLSWAERPAGPWHPHSANPVRSGRDGSRPGGAAIVIDGAPVLPVQDCSATYGGAIRPLRIVRLTTEAFEAELGPAITAPARFAPFDRGLHTISPLGQATLIDVKRRLLSPRSIAMLATRGRRAG